FQQYSFQTKRCWRIALSQQFDIDIVPSVSDRILRTSSVGLTPSATNSALVDGSQRLVALLSKVWEDSVAVEGTADAAQAKATMDVVEPPRREPTLAIRNVIRLVKRWSIGEFYFPHEDAAPSTSASTPSATSQLPKLVSRTALVASRKAVARLCVTAAEWL